MMDVLKPYGERIEKVWQEGKALFLQQEIGLIRIMPQTDTAVRISYTENGSFDERQGEEYIDLSSDVVWEWRENEKSIVINTAKLQIDISKEKGSITYKKQDGTELLKEKKGQGKQLESFEVYKTVNNDQIKVEEVQTPDGVKRRIKAADQEFDQILYRTRVNLDFAKDEVLLGFGQDENGAWNLRNTTKYLHQANRKIAIPFLISSNEYGILLSTQSTVILNHTDQHSFIQTDADYFLDYYFFGGESLFQVIKDFRCITGKAALLPEWAFGYIQSQERYESMDEILSVAQAFADKQIGLDCIVQDWLSWEDGQWGQKSFDPVRFYDPSKMMEELHKKDVHFMLSIWPNMSENTKDYAEFKKQGLLLPGTGIYNAFEKEARDLYWKQVQEHLFCHGIDAWWCDSSEPLTPEWEHRIEAEAGKLYAEYVEEASKVMPIQKINAFSLYHAKGLWEGQRSQTRDKRVVNLTRCGWAGSQKYGTILWSGDISASWNTLKKQVIAGLQFCASGLPYWTLDIGAFFVKHGRQWFWDGEYDQGNEDNAYRELYVRWFQYGALLPIFRAHGSDVRREPWQFGSTGEPMYEALLSAMKLRYRLLPYIYSLAAEAHFEDGLMMRPLLFDFAKDKCTYEVKDQYMFGPSLMVCPVLEPMYYEKNGEEIFEKTQKSREVYLPEGTSWYDWYTGKRYAGGQTILAEATIDKIPLFVKAGAIIPTREPKLNVTQMRDTPIELCIYPGENGTFNLYEDAGDNYNYEKGAYCKTQIVWDDETGKASWTTKGDLRFRQGELHVTVVSEN